MEIQNSHIQLWKFASLCVLLFWVAGCVDINDAKVQVQAPGQIENYSRNVLDKCPPQAYPHRLIVAQTGSNSILAQGGPSVVYAQADFERLWSYISVLDQGKISTSTLSQLPIVNWDQEVAYFLLVQTNNACEKSKPMGDEMITDCYTITIQLYRYLEGTDCPPPGMCSVFIYIYPKTGLPVNTQWFFPTPIPTATPKPAPKPTATPTATPTPVPSEDE